MHEKVIKEIRKKFLKDTKLPIPVYEDPYFDYFLDLYEDTLESRTLYNKFLEDVNELGIDVYNSYFRKLIDDVVNEVSSKECYGKLVSFETVYDNSILKNMDTKKNIYTENNINKKFISVDMNRANFSAFRTLDKELVNGKETYEEWLNDFEHGNLFLESKSIRQYIFGNLNPKRQQVLQKIYMVEFLKLVDSKVNLEGRTIFVLGADEVVFEYDLEFEKVLEEALGEFNKDITHSFNLRKEVFELNKLSKYKEFGYVKDYGNKKDLISVSKNFYAQAYKYMIGEKVEEYDLLFYYEGFLSQMLNKIVNESEENK